MLEKLCAIMPSSKKLQLTPIRDFIIHARRLRLPIRKKDSINLTRRLRVPIRTNVFWEQLGEVAIYRGSGVDQFGARFGVPGGGELSLFLSLMSSICSWRRLKTLGSRNAATIFSSPTIALSHLLKNKNDYDIVMVDVMMPDLDGLDLLQIVLRETDLPVILVSDRDDIKVVEKGINLGACQYLLKPVRMEELNKIWQHVYRKRLLLTKVALDCSVSVPDISYGDD